MVGRISVLVYSCLTVKVVLLFLIGREPIKVAAKLSIHPSRRAMRWSVLTRASTDSSCETKQNWRTLFQKRCHFM